MRLSARRLLRVPSVARGVSRTARHTHRCLLGVSLNRRNEAPGATLWLCGVLPLTHAVREAGVTEK